MTANEHYLLEEPAEEVPRDRFAGGAHLANGYLAELIQDVRSRVLTLEGRVETLESLLTIQATAPSASDDSYLVGTLWIDASVGAQYRCVDASPGAAVWGFCGYPPSGMWTDLRYPATGINPPGSANAPTRNADTGDLEFSASLDTVIVVSAQLDHGWLGGTSVGPHMHFHANPAGTDPAALVGNVDTRWRFEWKVYNVGGAVPAAFLAHELTIPMLPFDAPGEPTAQVANLASGGSLDMTGYRDSAMIAARITRLASDPLDTYADVVHLSEYDVHYRKNSLGSFSEFGDPS